MPKHEAPESFRKIFSDENEHRTFAKVFDYSTIHTVHSMAKQGHFDVLEFLISVGKEAHVFRAHDQNGEFRAVKIYKTDTSEFHHMTKYIEGDIRFGKMKKDKHQLVYTWTKKEFKNLELAARAGVRSPLPIAFKNNVLVMEFIGDENGNPSPPLQKKPAQNANAFFEEVLVQTARLYQAGLVHADLSEYNILNQNEKPVLIDVGQSVLLSHPSAAEFFERDIEHVVNYFRRKGVVTDAESAKEKIRTLLKEFKPKQSPKKPVQRTPGQRKNARSKPRTQKSKKRTSLKPRNPKPKKSAHASKTK